MYSIEVRERDEENMLVELWGEFDRHALEELRETLDGVVARRRPTMVDLSGVTFLDIGATREMTIRSRLYAHHLTLTNPSWQVRRSVAACGVEDWFGFSVGAEDSPEPPATVSSSSPNQGDARGRRAA
ncbi:MAG: STAS domain-containing protein [Actinomycetota bacterium]|nr:STAS domain-containing protein [Actinomycetota bacterium]